MRERVLAIKFSVLVLLCAGGSSTTAQEKSRQQSDWEATLQQMSEHNRRKYERLKTATFAQLELLPRLAESSEPPEAVFKPYKVGDKIFFRLLITNTSSETVSFPIADTFLYNRPELLRDGEVVAYRDGLRDLLKSKDKFPFDRDVRAHTLLPHETSDVIVQMKDWYEPLQPGRYLLKVKRRFIWGGEWIESPSIVFEVISK